MPQTQKKKSQVVPNIEGLLALAAQREEEEEKIRNNFEDLSDDDNDEPVGQLFDSMKETSNRTWIELTNFTKDEFFDLLRDIDAVSSVKLISKKGKKSKVSNADAFLALLILYKTAPKIDDLGERVKYLPTALRNALDRIRPLLNTALKNRWWKDRIRPIPLPNTPNRWIALIVDVNSIQVFRPKGRFEEAKVYWDNKNHMYALKMEVAVSASPPHFAQFVFRGRVGSQHDFAIHKENYQNYLPYLRKTNEELASMPEDRINRYWGILGDKAYFASANETPDERRFAIRKNPRTIADKSFNEEMTKIRVPVECFFGRMWKLWSLLRKPYPYDHNLFDGDYENMVLLTNEHIRATHPLEDSDQVFYKAFRENQKRQSEEKERKRREQVEGYLSRRKRRYEEAFRV
jgi:hypothetical protein